MNQNAGRRTVPIGYDNTPISQERAIEIGMDIRKSNGPKDTPNENAARLNILRIKEPDAYRHIIALIKAMLK